MQDTTSAAPAPAPSTAAPPAPDALEAPGQLRIGPDLVRALFHGSPFSTVIYDLEGRLLAANDAFEQLWGVPADTVPAGYTVLADEVLAREGLLPLVERAFRGETVTVPATWYDITRLSTTGGGRAVWVRGHFSPVRDAAGRLRYVLLTHVDLSDLKEAEEALRRREERLRLAQRAARTGTFDWHIPSGRVAWTEEEERIFGLAPGTFDGTLAGWARGVVPEDARRMEGEMAACMARGDREMDFGYRIRRPDGEVRWIEGSAEFLYDEAGAPLRMVGVNVDITEQREAQERRRRSEALLREAERIAGMGSWEWDPAEGTLTWSEEMYRVYGLDPQDAPVTTERFFSLIHPEDRAPVQEAVDAAVHARGSFAVDHRIVRPDGEVRTLHGRGRVVVDAAGRPVRLVGSGQDITARKEAEEALRRAKEEAEAANRAKSDFLATMSHELRTPLNAIAGYAELMELGIRGPVTDEQRQDLYRIQQSGRHLLGLINEVLNYARVEAGAVRYDPGHVPVAQVLAAAEALVVPQAAARGLALQAAPSAPALAVWADREKVQQILLNLLSNAVKFTEPGGRIHIAAAAEDGRVAVRVRDTGVGIPPDRLDAVFEPFVQVGRSLAAPVEGVGLGLAISRDLARGMGGDLWAESRPGTGSCFTLVLPLAPGSGEGPHPAA